MAAAAAAALQDSPEWDLPRLRSSLGFEDDYRHLKTKDKAEDEQEDKDTEFFDVKFYPHNPDGADSVFAAVSKKHILVCRLSQTDANVNPCEVIRIIRDDDEEATNCSCCWSRDVETERPLLCVAGSDAKVKVYDVKEGKLFTTLVGHGGEINDLASSPQNPCIIASASDDTTVRIWSLDPVHAKQPCLCLLGGEGHSWSLLSTAFHDSGRYMLSAGHDQVVNLWTIPDLPKQHVDTPIVVHYPHFSTSDVHFGLIDCVAFYGDLILSRACHEDKIVLWKIEGFCSEDPPPPPSTAPTAYDQSRTTRSAFASTSSPSCPSLWVRLLQFETPQCGPQFFLRFSLHHAHGQHPVLVFCNTKSEILMWDIARLTGYQSYINKIRDPNRDPAVRVKRPAWLQPNHHKMKKAASENPGDPVYRAAVTMRPVGHRDPFNVEAYLLEEQTPDTVESWQAKYDTSNPFKLIRAHKIEKFGGPRFLGRQVTWSSAGDWCVVAGSQNTVIMLQRWPKGGRQSSSRQNSHVPSEVPSRQGTAAMSTSFSARASTLSAQPDTVMLSCEGP
ncbi:WD40-repeat-containing domain protein [Diaporthe sp. PMI_573]|nr:WD40-repeat-containing domain protein [Diaporthaceae sp. PMI_573]